jgi:hypothetical protein
VRRGSLTSFLTIHMPFISFPYLIAMARALCCIEVVKLGILVLLLILQDASNGLFNLWTLCRDNFLLFLVFYCFVLEICWLLSTVLFVFIEMILIFILGEHLSHWLIDCFLLKHPCILGIKPAFHSIWTFSYAVDSVFFEDFCIYVN